MQKKLWIKDLLKLSDFYLEGYFVAGSQAEWEVSCRKKEKDESSDKSYSGERIWVMVLIIIKVASK